RARAPSCGRRAIPPRVRAHGARLRAAGPVPARGRLLPRHAPRPRRRRALGRPGAGAVIIESILTTVDARGAVNFAPMGVEWGEDEIVIKPFLETTTFRNLEATGAAVVNLTDDVMLFARGAISNVEFPARPAAVVPGVVLEAACSWREVRVHALGSPRRDDGRAGAVRRGAGAAAFRRAGPAGRPGSPLRGDRGRRPGAVAAGRSQPGAAPRGRGPGRDAGARVRPPVRCAPRGRAASPVSRPSRHPVTRGPRLGHPA